MSIFLGKFGQTWRRLQDFSLERAVDSAVGDWSEDVQPGQQAKYQSQVVPRIPEVKSMPMNCQ